MKLYKIILPLPVVCLVAFVSVQVGLKQQEQRRADLKTLAEYGITEQTASTEEPDMEPFRLDPEPKVPDYKHMTKKQLAMARAKALDEIWFAGMERDR